MLILNIIPIPLFGLGEVRRIIQNLAHQVQAYSKSKPTNKQGSPAIADNKRRAIYLITASLSVSNPYLFSSIQMQPSKTTCTIFDFDHPSIAITEQRTESESKYLGSAVQDGRTNGRIDGWTWTNRYNYKVSLFSTLFSEESCSVVSLSEQMSFQLGSLSCLSAISLWIAALHDCSVEVCLSVGWYWATVYTNQQ